MGRDIAHEKAHSLIYKTNYFSKFILMLPSEKTLPTAPTSRLRRMNFSFARIVWSVVLIVPRSASAYCRTIIRDREMRPVSHSILALKRRFKN